MNKLFMIGLPKDARLRTEAAARQREVELTSVLAGIGKEGTFKLLPHEDQAIYALQDYIKGTGEDYGTCHVCVLPYAPLPSDLQGELDTLEDLGATVVYPASGVDGWPSKSSAKRRDQAFWDGLHGALTATLPGQAPPRQQPSEYFRTVADANPRLIITQDSLQYADDVAEHRYEFLRRAADALALYTREGSGGRIDAFFASCGLDHAQSGGITATLRLHKDGATVLAQSCSTHLKQGDKTTRIAAARVYYHAFTIEGTPHAAVLYAGPHPEDDVERDHHLPSARDE